MARHAKDIEPEPVAPMSEEEKMLLDFERALDAADAAIGADRAAITQAAQLDAAEAVAMAGIAMESDDAAAEAKRLAIISERGGDREAIKVARKKARAARKKAKADHRAATKTARKAYEIAAKSYQVGRSTITDLNSAQLSLTQAQLAVSQAIYEFVLAKANLEETLGYDFTE